MAQKSSGTAKQRGEWTTKLQERREVLRQHGFTAATGTHGLPLAVPAAHNNVSIRWHAVAGGGCRHARMGKKTAQGVL